MTCCSRKSFYILAIIEYIEECMLYVCLGSGFFVSVSACAAMNISSHICQSFVLFNKFFHCHYMQMVWRSRARYKPETVVTQTKETHGTKHLNHIFDFVQTRENEKCVCVVCVTEAKIFKIIKTSERPRLPFGCFIKI